ncbi:hypothetical protein ES702_02686 [subsurface metagenome]
MENFRSQCSEEFNSFFKQTQKRNKNQFLISLLGIRKEPKIRNLLTIPYIPEMEFEEVCAVTNLFIRIIDGINPSKDKTNRRNSIRLKLFVYCHLIEVDFYYNIIANLLRTLANSSYIENLLVGETLKKKKNTLQKLCKKCRGNGIEIHLDKIYEKVCNDDCLDLRNAFVHSQYITSPSGDVVLTKKIFSQKSSFSSDKINTLFESTITFLNTFIETYRKAMRPYQQIEPIRINYLGKNLYIKYHKKRKSWIFAKE